ncbi:MAG: hypothetical protein LC776_06505 [Acidobacteria bacterium]|nr:hypothetical protein [Acidobacteriota bacterium]
MKLAIVNSVAVGAGTAVAAGKAPTTWRTLCAVIDDSVESGEDLLVPGAVRRIGGLNVEDRQRDCWNLVRSDYSGSTSLRAADTITSTTAHWRWIFGIRYDTGRNKLALALCG